MELKTYLMIVLKKWWIVLPAFLATVTTTIVLTFTTTPTYESKTTYVVSPLADDSKNFTSQLGLLSREEVVGTYAEIANSFTIKDLAIKPLNLKTGKGYKVSSERLSGSTLLIIKVTGPVQTYTQQIAANIGIETKKYVDKTNQPYSLSLLDEANFPKNKVAPDEKNNIMLGAAFGLILGIGLAFLAEALSEPELVQEVALGIIDQETGLYNREYFMDRLTQEMARARRNRSALALTLMRIDHSSLSKRDNLADISSQVLRKVAKMVNAQLREEDIIAHFGMGMFAFLLPDTSGENAKSIMEYVQSMVDWASFEVEDGDNNTVFTFKGVVGIATYNYSSITHNELLDVARRALRLSSVDNEVYLIEDIPAEPKKPIKDTVVPEMTPA